MTNSNPAAYSNNANQQQPLQSLPSATDLQQPQQQLQQPQMMLPIPYYPQQPQIINPQQYQQMQYQQMQQFQQFHQMQQQQQQLPPQIAFAQYPPPPPQVQMQLPIQYQQQQQPMQMQQIPQQIHQQQQQQQQQMSQPPHSQPNQLPQPPHLQPNQLPQPDVSAIKNDKTPKRATSAAKLKHQKKVSAFVTKLYSMLHDPALSHLIWWSRLYQNDLTTFALLPGTDFASCLTTYFKHGNVASFVRQLHMYGFHKVCEGNQQHILNSNNNNSSANPDSNHTIWEFRHSSGKFRRCDQSYLHLIKRRVNSRRTSSNSDLTSINSLESTIVNSSSIDLIANEPLRSQSTLSSKELNLTDDTSMNSTNNMIPSKINYKPVYFSAEEIEKQQQQFPQPTIKEEKSLKDPFENRSKSDLPNRVFSPNSRQSPNSIPFQQAPTSTSIPNQNSAAQLPRPYSPNGRLSPVSYRQNVFFQESRQRYPSVFIDPCAPAPNSNSNTSQPPERARSPPPSLPLQQQNSSQPPSFLMSPRNVRSITENNLPPISSISSQTSLPQSPAHSISSTKSNRFHFSRNSSAASTHLGQLRPSIFDIHQQTSNSSISAHNSIFSNGSSISSNGSIGSRYGSSISSMLNDDRRLPSLTNGSISLPVTSSSLKTVTSYINDSSSSGGRSQSPEDHIYESKLSTEVITASENNAATTTTTKTISKINQILNHTEEKATTAK